jgi:hypothetical protein
MDMLLYPELFPTLSNPSSTFTISPSGLKEIGEVLATISVSSAFARGSISPAYGTSGYRSGLPNQYVYTGPDLSSEYSTSLTNNKTISSYTVLSGAQSWTGRVAYDAGEQPLSSKGNNYSTPLSAGNTSIITRTITGVLPIFCTTVSITVLTKQTLQNHGSIITETFVAESGSDKQELEIPHLWGTLSALAQYNTLSGLWDSISTSSFTVTNTIRDINGTNYDYDLYTHNGSTIGSRQLRFTF